MIKRILGSLLLVFCVISGAVAADFIKNRPVEVSDNSGNKASKGHSKKDDNIKSDKSKKEKKDKRGHDKSASLDGPTYFKFKRQFVVPVMGDNKIEALIITNLNFELNNDAPENIYSYEPKLRDKLTRELLAMSNKGLFNENLTTPESYEEIRSVLLKAGQQIIPEGIQDILILDLARQEQ